MGTSDNSRISHVTDLFNTSCKTLSKLKMPKCGLTAFFHTTLVEYSLTGQGPGVTRIQRCSIRESCVVIKTSSSKLGKVVQEQTSFMTCNKVERNIIVLSPFLKDHCEQYRNFYIQFETNSAS